MSNNEIVIRLANIAHMCNEEDEQQLDILVAIISLIADIRSEEDK